MKERFGSGTRNLGIRWSRTGGREEGTGLTPAEEDIVTCFGFVAVVNWSGLQRRRVAFCSREGKSDGEADKGLEREKENQMKNWKMRWRRR
jgi:hypothetical protein